MAVDDRFPAAVTDDQQNFRYSQGPLGPKSQETMIGGTHNVSTKLTPEQALTGAYTPLPGDEHPYTMGEPYLPKN